MKKPVVVILSGGLGKSFAPLSINKTLLPIFGKPVLQHMLEMVEQSGFVKHLSYKPENESWLASYQPLIQFKLRFSAGGMGMQFGIEQKYMIGLY
jgi:NDP-sugar pyrophosphorylase family protein